MKDKLEAGDIAYVRPEKKQKFEKMFGDAKMLNEDELFDQVRCDCKFNLARGMLALTCRLL
jgi:hypothetical protein